ncbi:buddy of Hmr 2 [Musca autumnalis]|uniref:buddy of Hmr 2 n=1 Tax=Musca autumnalis TaxID=221902 RepID=UPI003CEC1D27
MMSSTETSTPHATGGGGGTTNNPSSGSGHTTQTSERRCENPDCNVNKLISMVPKRKSTQFISDPKVMDKPMLVNGFTAVFQVEGQSAKLMDIKNPNGDANTKAIYRIVPNSHVHVVNYVVVDTDESYLKKITNNDPATMQKLLTTQKDSADKMLRNIMNGQGSTATAASTTVVSTINPQQNTTLNRSMDQSLPTNTTTFNTTTIPAPMNAAAPKPPSSLSITMTSTAAPTAASITTNKSINIVGGNMGGVKVIPKASINLPVRMHPNLKITAVASVDTGGNAIPLNTAAAAVAADSSNTIAHPSPPFIQPIPLANLQTPAAVASAATSTTAALTTPAILNLQPKTVPPPPGAAAAPNPVMNVVPDKPTYDRMREEINDLRRTVAMLAEAQAKNLNQQQQQQPGAGPVPTKRPRLPQ